MGKGTTAQRRDRNRASDRRTQTIQGAEPVVRKRFAWVDQLRTSAPAGERHVPIATDAQTTQAPSGLSPIALLRASNQERGQSGASPRIVPGGTSRLGLGIGHGSGQPFGAVERARYAALKRSPEMAMGIYDLERGAWVYSKDAERVVRGASVHKAFVMAARFAHHGGEPPAGELAELATMIRKSDNPIWVKYKGWNADPYRIVDRGKMDALQAFFRQHGYDQSGADAMDNRLNLDAVARLYSDIYRGRLPGSESMMELLAGCETNAARSRKYLPPGWVVGGKTGSFKDTSWDTAVIHHPATGKAYLVAAFHHTRPEAFSHENVALAIGGMVDEFAAL